MSSRAQARVAAEEIADEEATSAAEYASVTVKIDHLVREPHPNGHVVVSDVWSTETATEALLAQLDYFGDNDILRAKGVMSMIVQGETKAAVFVYQINDNQTNVIVDAALWSEMLANLDLSKGTVMGCHAAVITLATDLRRTANAEGRTDRVLCFLSD